MLQFYVCKVLWTSDSRSASSSLYQLNIRRFWRDGILSWETSDCMRSQALEYLCCISFVSFFLRELRRTAPCLIILKTSLRLLDDVSPQNELLVPSQFALGFRGASSPGMPHPVHAPRHTGHIGLPLCRSSGFSEIIIRTEESSSEQSSNASKRCSCSKSIYSGALSWP